jgi:hypothetical protein
MGGGGGIVDINVIKYKNRICGFFKVFYKNSIFIDVFCFDYYYKNIELNEQQDFQNKITQFGDKVLNEIKNRKLIIQNNNKININLLGQGFKLQSDLIMDGNLPNENDGAIFDSLCFNHSINHIVCDKKSVFPLKEYKFGNYSFMGPNQPDILLYKKYGNFYDYPSSMGRHHKIDIDMILSCKEFLEIPNEELLRDII